MREVFINLALFLVLSVSMSALTSCSGSADPAKDPAGEPTNSAAAKANRVPSSEYPPLSTAVAQSDVANLDGSTFKIEDKKGKVLLLNMWATWCGPCRAEMPALVRMQNKYRDKEFEVIGLNTDDADTNEMIEAFAADMSLNYVLVRADTKLQSELVKISKFGGIPQSFVVDRDGRLRSVFRGANPVDVRKMEEVVEKVVNEG